MLETYNLSTTSDTTPRRQTFSHLLFRWTYPPNLTYFRIHQSVAWLPLFSKELGGHTSRHPLYPEFHAYLSGWRQRCNTSNTVIGFDFLRRRTAVEFVLFCGASPNNILTEKLNRTCSPDFKFQAPNPFKQAWFDRIWNFILLFQWDFTVAQRKYRKNHLGSGLHKGPATGTGMIDTDKTPQHKNRHNALWFDDTRFLVMTSPIQDLYMTNTHHHLTYLFHIYTIPNDDKPVG